jgi:hypothetical protein
LIPPVRGGSAGCRPGSRPASGKMTDVTDRAGVRGFAPAVAMMLTIAALSAIWLAIGRQWGFYTALNDFWGTFFLADQLSLSDTRTLHNGFFPIGYPALLRMLRSESILIVAFVLSVACGAAMMAVVYGWLASRVWPWLVVGVTLAMAAQPLVFVHAVTAAPDMPSTLAAVAGVLLLAGAIDRQRWPHALAAGVLLGVSGLCRYHGFVFGGAAVAAALAIWPSRWRLAGLAAIGFGAMGGLQVAANVTAGVPQFQTAQAFNVYKMFNPVDWWHLSVTAYPASVIDVIRLSPERFRASYWSILAPSLYLIVPPLAAALLPGRHRRAGWFLTMTTAIYLPVQAIGGSPRGPLPVVPLFFAGIALALQSVIDWAWHTSLSVRRGSALAAGAALFALALANWIPENRAVVTMIGGMADLWAKTEAALRADGARHPAQVFTDRGAASTIARATPAVGRRLICTGTRRFILPCG